MIKIKEAYVSFEVAKLLKEKGNFNVPCLRVYDKNGIVCIRYSGFDIPHNYTNTLLYLCPTHQMAMAWLREVHNIFIVIEPNLYDYINEKNSSYMCSLWQGDNYYEKLLSKDFPSYEEAVEVALKYTLENLI